MTEKGSEQGLARKQSSEKIRELRQKEPLLCMFLNLKSSSSLCELNIGIYSVKTEIVAVIHLSLCPVFSGMVPSINSQEPRYVFLQQKSTYSNEEESNGFCFPTIQWEVDSQSLVGDDSFGGPVSPPDDSNCLSGLPHLTCPHILSVPATLHSFQFQ